MRGWVVWGNPVGYITLEGTGLNAFVYRALADAAFLGETIGQRAETDRLEKAARDLAVAFNTVLWDQRVGTYCSGYLDPARPEFAGRAPNLTVENNLVAPTVYSAIFALDRGIVPAARRERVVNYLLEHRDPRGQVMIYYYLHKLLYAAGPDYDREILRLLPAKMAGHGRFAHRVFVGRFQGRFARALLRDVSRLFLECVCAGRPPRRSRGRKAARHRAASR